ncbi:MAG: PIG-L deacetylase family protein [Anaerolineales bacterium]|jgi:LmbE family N-acetylglucosaminyl deacetylase|nr:PIG-L deacetylase family protein [Anaerolineales bacterium]MDP7644378.1 PIG-L deacetylase family protein [Anaerolineales bacterium]HJN42289.1 PIG-L deacetylase family protein [Anaerolineales bacterium]|tara:strand:+ start:1172 stop:1942 length:771 start_codon:yes stop_codon:yes gene_type:complete
MNDNHRYLPESAMAIAAHPDDIEFGCAGTLAGWAQAGARISYVLCTSGDVGIARPGMTKKEAAAIREKEQRAAADIVGATEVVFLREPDGMLQATLELRKKLVREIRRFRPEVVFCGDPTRLWVAGTYINHPDHRAAALAAVDAIFPAAGQPNMFEELAEEDLTAFKPRKVYASRWAEGGHLVTIDDTMEIKLSALRAHSSQFEQWDPDDFVRERAAHLAEGHDMDFAEAFTVTTLESDELWEQHRGEAMGRHPGA